MTVKQLIAKLCSLPPDAIVATEQEGKLQEVEFVRTYNLLYDEQCNSFLDIPGAEDVMADAPNSIVVTL